MSTQYDIKAKAEPPEMPKWQRWYYDAKWWFTNNVWYAHAPDWLRHAWWDIKDFWYKQVSCRLFPRQAWLTKAAGREWHDKPELIPTILYAAVIHFVEGEKCFEVTNWEGSGLTEQKKELQEIYQWAKTGRAAFYERIRAAYPPSPKPDEDIFKWLNKDDPTRKACYAEVNRLEAEMEEWDTRCLTWIIKNRGCLWT